MPVSVEIQAKLHGGPGGELQDTDVHALLGDGQLAGEGLHVAQQTLKVAVSHTGGSVQQEHHISLAQTAWGHQI